MTSAHDKTPRRIKLDEKNHVEEPFLDQLEGLGWDVVRLEQKQQPAQSQRESFSQVVIEPLLQKGLQTINPWLEPSQIDEVVAQVTNLPASSLIENNRTILELLLENTSVSENRKNGDRNPTVKIFDFETPQNNNFTAISQFKMRIPGTEHHILPDIILFVNGLPVCVIECKSPKVKEPLPEAIDQLMRYSQQRGASKEGVPALFAYNQFVVATCRQQAKFGTITTHNEKHFYRWADPYPRSVDDLGHMAGVKVGKSAPNDQQRLVAGMMDKTNLLDLIRSYTLFTTSDDGHLIKIVARYQQFRAVKLAVDRLLKGGTPRDRSGIIWHTQGSGKSLTMMFMVREMYKHPKLADWKIIFITDRTQLEKQLTETSGNIGFTVKIANKISKLKELLSTDTSDLVMAMIQKFQENDLQETFPLLNDSNKILIMTDEAHRSQYKLLGANLERALPNASRIGYTGTPIDKTEQVFGGYIDMYTMRQAIDDGVTLEITYEGRTHNAEVEDRAGMDAAFADIFSDYNIGERLEILGYGSKQAYLEAEETIGAKADDMLRHYVRHVFTNGLKAQIVTASREAAVRYKAAIESALKSLVAELEKENPLKIDIATLKNLEAGVVISSSHNDKPHLKACSNPSQHETITKSFKLPFKAEEDGINGNTGILIVNNMLLTGFDAPIEQVMYLDKVITNHNLLQAIARVNRVGDKNKDQGFVVDYVGVGHHLKAALDFYDEKEQQDILDVLESSDENLRELEASHKSLKDLLDQYGLDDLSDHDAFFDLFYDEEIRFEFILAFKNMTRALNLVFPRKEALEYFGEYQQLAEINVMAGRHLNDKRLSMKGIPDKLRIITDGYLKSKGIEQKIKPVSIMNDDFDKEIGERKREKTKAATAEHAIRHHIDMHLDEDPELYASFADALSLIFEEFANNWQRILEELEKLRGKMREAEKEDTFGLHRKKEMPFFRILKREIFADIHLNDNQVTLLVDLTQNMFNLIERELKLTGFWQSPPARNRLKEEIKILILSEQYANLPDIFSIRDKVISRVIETAQSNNDTILYAS